MVLDAVVRCQNERVIAALEHAYSKAVYGSLDFGKELAHHGVTGTPYQETDGVWVYPRHDESHCLSRLEGERADI